MKFPSSHCNYLDIYISQKIRLCVTSWFWRPISNQPAGRIHKLFDLKIQIYYTHFSSFFAGIVKSNAFFTLSLLFQKGWYIWVIFCVKSQLQYFNSLEQQWQCAKSSEFDNSCKKRRKMSIIDINFQINKLVILACRLVWNWPSKSPLQSLIFCEM